MNPLNANNPNISMDHRAQRPFLRGCDLFRDLGKEPKISSRVGHFFKASLLVVIGSIPFGVSYLNNYMKNKNVKDITHDEVEGTHNKVNVVVLGLKGDFISSLHKAVQEEHPEWSVKLVIAPTLNKGPDLSEVGNPDVLIVGAQAAGGRMVVRTDIQSDYKKLLDAGPEKDRLTRTFLVVQGKNDLADDQLLDPDMKDVAKQTAQGGKIQLPELDARDHLWSYHGTSSKLTGKQDAMLAKTIASLNQRSLPQ